MTNIQSRCIAVLSSRIAEMKDSLAQAGHVQHYSIAIELMKRFEGYVFLPRHFRTTGDLKNDTTGHGKWLAHHDIEITAHPVKDDQLIWKDGKLLECSFISLGQLSHVATSYIAQDGSIVNAKGEVKATGLFSGKLLGTFGFEWNGRRQTSPAKAAQKGTDTEAKRIEAYLTRFKASATERKAHALAKTLNDTCHLHFIWVCFFDSDVSGSRHFGRKANEQLRCYNKYTGEVIYSFTREEVEAGLPELSYGTKQEVEQTFEAPEAVVVHGRKPAGGAFTFRLNGKTIVVESWECYDRLRNGLAQVVTNQQDYIDFHTYLRMKNRPAKLVITDKGMVEMLKSL